MSVVKGVILKIDVKKKLIISYDLSKYLYVVPSKICPGIAPLWEELKRRIILSSHCLNKLSRNRVLKTIINRDIV